MRCPTTHVYMPDWVFMKINSETPYLWRAIKYKEVYLPTYAWGLQARAFFGRYLGIDNTRRPDSSLDGPAPDQALFNMHAPAVAAA